MAQKIFLASGEEEWQAVEKIHNATLDILLHQGVVFQSEEALAIFQDHGVKVDQGKRAVYIKPEMVEKALQKAPSSFVMAARDPQRNYMISPTQTGFTTFGTGFSVIDRKTGLLRDSTKLDVAESAILSDYLDSLDVYTHALTARDCSFRAIDLHEAEAFLCNTTKHCMHGNLGGKENIKKYIAMVGLLVDGVSSLPERPVASGMTCPQSPLYFPQECCDVIMELGRVGLPVNILPMVIASQTAPATLAGTMVVNNAEVLAGLVLAELSTPGAPIFYGCSSTAFDLIRCTAPVGSWELGLCSAMATKMAQYYQIPSYVAGT